MIAVSSVPTKIVAEVWRGGAERWIQAALDYEPVARYAPDDVLAEILAEKAALWVAIDADNRADPIGAALVTIVIEYPRLREFHMPWCGGRDLWKWAREIDRATDEAARAHGCAIKTCGGRAGWRRFGYRNVGVMLMKDIAL